MTKIVRENIARNRGCTPMKAGSISVPISTSRRTKPSYTSGEYARGDVNTNSDGFCARKKGRGWRFWSGAGQPAKKGESATIRVAYSGKDVVRNEGGENYYPIARQSWYPNSSSGLGDFVTYHMLFHVPKGLELIATGSKVGENTEGKITTTEWETDGPLAVVGFNLGKFVMKEAKLDSTSGKSLTIDAYANTAPPSSFVPMDTGPQREASADYYADAMGKFDAPSKLPAQLTQAQAAAQLYTGYFGTLPFTKIAVTQQFACNYGQSWPMLVFLPSCAFMDSSQQYMMGVRPVLKAHQSIDHTAAIAAGSRQPGPLAEHVAGPPDEVVHFDTKIRNQSTWNTSCQKYLRRNGG